ncbi:hypothetical protein [Leptospira ilyithenensis]|uniref:Uncharacterized protein n=1 Tax=Leptospira ilyithenensis TaxID=2484901 RepID=A0A4R9LQ60_9LEPT|nr:hypothetical protein [Leptospira ilyithenensis]TGN09755.1 hypothetical protein EHS11_11780 [Leptospira ilyithenensis]
MSDIEKLKTIVESQRIVIINLFKILELKNLLPTSVKGDGNRKQPIPEYAELKEELHALQNAHLL